MIETQPRANTPLYGTPSRARIRPRVIYAQNPVIPLELPLELGRPNGQRDWLLGRKTPARKPLEPRRASRGRLATKCNGPSQPRCTDSTQAYGGLRSESLPRSVWNQARLGQSMTDGKTLHGWKKPRTAKPRHRQAPAIGDGKPREIGASRSYAIGGTSQCGRLEVRSQTIGGLETQGLNRV